MMMYHPNAQLVQPTALAVAPCLLTAQLCTCVFGSTQQPCSLHHPPIAYGQASSSFMPAASSQVTTSQSVSSTTTSQQTEPTASSGQHVQPALQRIEQHNISIEMARNQTRLPATLSSSMRHQMRLKRSTPSSLPAQVQHALDARAPKLRRVASDGSREVQSVRPETVPQQSSAPVQVVQPELQVLHPSTSQLVTGTVPSTHQLCSACSANQQRSCSCTPCVCTLCPSSLAARATMVQPSPTSVPLTLQASRVIPAVQASHRAQAQHLANVQQQVAEHHHRIFQQHQQILNSQPYYRNFYTTPAAGVFVPLNRTAAIGLDAFLVTNITHHPEYLLERPLDRHHMFTAPATDPQPVGLSVQDIEKYSEKLPFVKDCELPEEEQERCTVCQCELETGEEVRHLSCSHQFHVECIDRWLGYNKKCPVCRLDVDQTKAVFVE